MAVLQFHPEAEKMLPLGTIITAPCIATNLARNGSFESYILRIDCHIYHSDLTSNDNHSVNEIPRCA